MFYLNKCFLGEQRNFFQKLNVNVSIMHSYDDLLIWSIGLYVYSFTNNQGRYTTQSSTSLHTCTVWERE